MTESGLTDRQRYWFDHLKSAEVKGTTLVAYAAAQGLKTKELYNWKSRFIKRGLMSSSMKARDFIPVRTEVRGQCCIHLPNGVRVEFNSLSDRAMREILVSASSLP